MGFLLLLVVVIVLFAWLYRYRNGGRELADLSMLESVLLVVLLLLGLYAIVRIVVN